MVVTKSEELSNQLTELSTMVKNMDTGLSTKIDNLSATTNNLQQRIEEVNTDISNELKNIRGDINEEITILKNSDAEILRQFANFEDDANAKIATLSRQLAETKDQLEEKSTNLEAASSQIVLQTQKIVSLEKSCHRGLQHGRSFNIEIDGIPANVGDDPEQLQEAALKILNAINADVSEFDIDTIHRLPSRNSPKPTIVRFVSRKSVREVHSNKRKLRDISELNIDIPGINDDTRIFVRASQCAFYKNLAFNCRMLKRNGDVSKIITAVDGKITIQRADNLAYVKVTHGSVLSSNFPDFDNFDFNYDDREEVVRDEQE